MPATNNPVARQRRSRNKAINAVTTPKTAAENASVAAFINTWKPARSSVLNNAMIQPTVIPKYGASNRNPPPAVMRQSRVRRER